MTAVELLLGLNAAALFFLGWRIRAYKASRSRCHDPDCARISTHTCEHCKAPLCNTHKHTLYRGACFISAKLPDEARK